MVNQVFLAVVVILATAQTSWLFIDSKIFAGFRKMIEAKFGDFRKSNITYLFTVCHWCLNTWASFFWTALTLTASWLTLGLDWRLAVMLWLPGSLGASYLASRLRDTEGE